MELLRVEHLSRYYGEGPAQVKALDDVSFSVEKGSLSPLWARLAVEKAPSCTCLEGWTSPQPDMYGYRAPIFTNWTRTHWPFFDGAR